MSNSASAIKAAEAALDKGDYNLCIKIIDPLLLSFSTATPIGSQLRLLKVTAYMGLGDEQNAINICQTLINSKDANVRQQSKQLLSILDAPSLPRPSNWSVEIPKIEMESSLKSSSRKPKRKKKKVNHPPTGPTKNLDFGFSIITLLIISLLAFLLSGCVDISTNLSITSSNRLKISLDIDSISSKSIPWQIEFADNLAKENSVFKIQAEGNKQHFESPTIRFEEANELLQQITSVVSNTSGFNINKPELTTTNRNWIIGANQNLKIYFDLRELPKVPGLKLNLIIHGIQNKNNFKTQPLEPIFKKGLTSLPLKIGQINQLEVSYWKWNQIAVGLILIISLILISLFLQTFRLNMGFGFPELPP
ncbi:DUF3153 domain-containing protein [Prochlorococcus marinus]|uniref:DUF3153 domain-containing protein n=1 Tax=Prochlorococcus marinus XMU1408 TaxID=2213228 RepID=A0A318RFJ4_PROMR|nr:DUF3153 domain-containing protein [Prochlorococcus marinus]MBW3041525.1 DUF3153 domain-containing protein [Prochlorococcus marinus str. XMU1408]PYE02683.1 DUF3153 domain-containing protein [Prochlorococcus marinus XMU1408]